MKIENILPDFINKRKLNLDLELAIRDNDVELIQRYIAEDCEYHQHITKNEVHNCFQSQYEITYKSLFGYCPCQFYVDAMYFSARLNKLEAVKIFFPLIPKTFLHTFLMWTISHKAHDCFRWLVTAYNYKLIENNNLWHHVIAQNDPPTIELCLELDPELERWFPDGLSTAVLNDAVEVLKWFHQRGFDFRNCFPEYIDGAVEAGYVDSLCFLFEHGYTPQNLRSETEQKILKLDNPRLKRLWISCKVLGELET